MISTYCEYIDRYVRRTGRSSPSPGEHHFVSAYLVPKLFAINSMVPDYINPDGTKFILGDVVYYKNSSHHFGIEVKSERISLSKREFDKWIVETDSRAWPNLFIGIDVTGITIATWKEFRHAYVAAVQDKKCNWSPRTISDECVPTKKVDLLIQHLAPEAHFRYSAIIGEASELETKFTETLRRSIPQ